MKYLRILGSGDLVKLAEYYGTDKQGSHFYAPHYQLHFQKFRFKKINLLEIGAGGEENPLEGGCSLRMWKNYFPFANIFSIDIFDKSLIQEPRIKIFKGNQADEGFLDKVVKEIGEIDIIIDDGSHLNDHVIRTFTHLFQYLKDGGIYVIEDTQTSYWPDFGGQSQDLVNSLTSMNFLKSLTDSLNHKEIIQPGYQPNYFDRKITSIHFYHNLVFVYKGDNSEESTRLVNNQRYYY